MDIDIDRDIDIDIDIDIDRDRDRLIVNIFFVDSNANCSVVLLANGHYCADTHLWDDAHLYSVDVVGCSTRKGISSYLIHMYLFRL